MPKFDCKVVCKRLSELQDLKKSFDIGAKKVFETDDRTSPDLDKIGEKIFSYLQYLETETAESFEDRGLGEMEKILDKEGTSNILRHRIAEGLAGCDSERAWFLREELLDWGIDKLFVISGIAGLESEKAWKMRDECVANQEVENFVIESLAGIDSVRAWQMRWKFFDINLGLRKVTPESFAKSLAGLNSEEAWIMRKKLMDNMVSDETILKSLAGVDSDKAWKLRDKLMKSNPIIGNYQISQSLAGCNSNRAWALREHLYYSKAEEDKGYIAESLVGLNTRLAWEMREGILKLDSKNISSVLRGLAGIDSDRAWKMRHEYMANESIKSPVIDGIFGNSLTSPKVICKNQG